MISFFIFCLGLSLIGGLIATIVHLVNWTKANKKIQYKRSLACHALGIWAEKLSREKLIRVELRDAELLAVVREIGTQNLLQYDDVLWNYHISAEKAERQLKEGTFIP
jgi:hypothetical protein